MIPTYHLQLKSAILFGCQVNDLELMLSYMEKLSFIECRSVRQFDKCSIGRSHISQVELSLPEINYSVTARY